MVATRLNALGSMIVVAVAVLIAGCSRPSPSQPSAVSSPASTTRIGTAAGYFVLQGAIRDKYDESGGPSGWLGEPTSSEKAGPDGGRLNEFQHGSIYWSARTGAHSIAGRILWAWNADGGPAGPLGYPSSDGRPIAGGAESRFEHGTITDIGGHTYVRLDIAADDGE